jgi:hypothetical protein
MSRRSPEALPEFGFNHIATTIAPGKTIPEEANTPPRRNENEQLTDETLQISFPERDLTTSLMVQFDSDDSCGTDTENDNITPGTDEHGYMTNDEEAMVEFFNQVREQFDKRFRVNLDEEALRASLSFCDGGGADLRAGGETEEEVRTDVRREVEADVRAAIREEVEDDVRAIIREEVEDDVRAIIREEVEDDVRAAIREEVEDDVRAIIREEVEDDVRAIIREEVEADVRAAIREEVEDDVRAIIREEVEDDVRAIIREEVEADVRAAIREEVEDDVRAIIREEVEDDVRADIREEVEDDVRVIIREKVEDQARVQSEASVDDDDGEEQCSYWALGEKSFMYPNIYKDDSMRMMYEQSYLTASWYADITLQLPEYIHQTSLVVDKLLQEAGSGCSNALVRRRLRELYSEKCERFFVNIRELLFFRDVGDELREQLRLEFGDDGSTRRGFGEEHAPIHNIEKTAKYTAEKSLTSSTEKNVQSNIVATCISYSFRVVAAMGVVSSAAAILAYIAPLETMCSHSTYF